MIWLGKWFVALYYEMQISTHQSSRLLELNSSNETAVRKLGRYSRFTRITEHDYRVCLAMFADLALVLISGLKTFCARVHFSMVIDWSNS